MSSSNGEIVKLYERYREFDLLVDSRRLIDPAKTLFLALPGARTDGHVFIPALLRAGVRHFMIQEAYWVRHLEQAEQVEELSLYAEATFIAVEDVLATFQGLAAHHRRQFKIPVIAITGSNGKTIVKDWLTEILSTHFRICSSPRSYNSQIGVPLSVWQLNEQHELAVFEAGVSQAGEMEKLAAIIAPTHGIFTNIGEAHAAGFKTRAEKLGEKLLLFNKVSWLLVNAGEPEVLAAARSGQLPVITCQEQAEQISVETQTQRLPLEQLPDLPAVLRHDAQLAMAAALLLGTPPPLITQQSGELEPLELRLQVRAGANGSYLINDTYSNDLTSLAAALQFAQTQAPTERLTLILSDLAQTGTPPEVTYRRVAQLLAGKLHRLITVGEESKWLAQLLPPLNQGLELHHFSDTRALATSLPRFSFAGETILLKGARSFGLERLIDGLTMRRHRTVLEIDLDAIAHNLAIYQAGLPAGVGLAVMVKASAYGSGSIQVSRLLADAGVEYLVVAYTDEGIALREAGISTPVMVLSPNNNELALIGDYDLEPVIADLPQLEGLLNFNPELPFHLEFDTGMRRLGFEELMLPQIVDRLQNYGRAPRSIFTHLAASDARAHDAYTNAQFAAFQRIQTFFSERGVNIPIRHVLNTNGISRFPDRAYEMVRLGIGLYGLGDPARKNMLRPAIRLKAAISGIRKVDQEQDASVGYGLRGKVAAGEHLAVVSIGYADGLPRLAGERRYHLLVNGRPAPIVGAVCMDMCMIDLTGLPIPAIDDEVIVFGPEHPIEVLAAAAQTIPYEILTGIGPRVHRIYSRE